MTTPRHQWNKLFYSSHNNLTTCEQAIACLQSQVPLLNMVDVKGKTALYYAVKENHTAFALAMLSLGADPNLSNASLLLQTMQHENVVLFRALIRHGADPNLRSKYLPIVPLYKAIQINNTEMVDLLLQVGADPNVSIVQYSYPLLTAAAATCTCDIVLLLLKAGAHVNEPSRVRKDFALHVACERRDTQEALAIVQALIEYGAAVNRVDAYGKTPLDRSCEFANYAVAQLLIEHGASLARLDVRPFTALCEAVTGVVYGAFGRTNPAPIQSLQFIEYMAKQHVARGEEIQRPDARNPAIVAISLGAYNIAMVLLPYCLRVNPDLRDSEMRNAITVCMNRQFPSIHVFERLLQLGASPNQCMGLLSNPYTNTKHHCTVMLIEKSATFRDTRFFQTLLNYGALVTAKTLHILLYERRIQLFIRYLQQHPQFADSECAIADAYHWKHEATNSEAQPKSLLRRAIEKNSVKAVRVLLRLKQSPCTESIYCIHCCESIKRRIKAAEKRKTMVKQSVQHA